MNTHDSSLIFVDYLLTILDNLNRSQEIYDALSGDDHAGNCAMCAGLVPSELVGMWSLFFAVHRMKHWGFMKTKVKKGKEIVFEQNMDMKLWKNQECFICRGTMEHFENIVGLPECHHYFHEYCFLCYVVQQIERNSNEIVHCKICKMPAYTNSNLSLNQYPDVIHP